MNKEIKRFQECNLIVRLYRRLRWQPLYFFKALFIAIKTALSKDSSMEPELAFKLIYAEWNTKANWYYTPEEVFSHLREEIEKQKKR